MSDAGKRIMLLRKERGMTQTDLANKMGLSQQYIARIENGSAKPRSLEKFADIFGVTEEELHKGTENIQINISGTQLKEIRENKGISKEQLAEKIGTTIQTITRIEQERSPSSKFIPLICEYLEIATVIKESNESKALEMAEMLDECLDDAISATVTMLRKHGLSDHSITDEQVISNCKLFLKSSFYGKLTGDYLYFLTGKQQSKTS